MKLLRFETMNESKKQSTKDCETLAVDLITKELQKNAMTRSDMIKFVEENKDVIAKCGDDDIKKVARTSTDTVLEDNKKLGIKLDSVSIKNKDLKYSMVFHFIGDVAGNKIKDKKNEVDTKDKVQSKETADKIKEKTKPTKESMIISFNNFLNS